MNNLARHPLGINKKVFWIIDYKVAMHFATKTELKGKVMSQKKPGEQ